MGTTLHEDQVPSAPDPEDRQAWRAARQAVIFEEIMRAAAGFMAVVFSVSLLTVLPLVPRWVFPAALGGVLLALPATVSVRLGQLRGDGRDLRALWNSALLANGTFALVLALLVVIAQVTDLGTALFRLAGVLAALAVIAFIRGWRPSEPRHLEDRAGEHP